MLLLGYNFLLIFTKIGVMSVNSVVNFYKNFHDGDTTVPSVKVQREISDCINEVTQGVLDDLATKLRTSSLHKTRKSILATAPRTSGPYEEDKVLLRNVSPFEQFVAYKDYMASKQIKKIHTQFLASGLDEYVQVRIKPQKQTNLMHLMLGATRGAKAAPEYVDLAKGGPEVEQLEEIFAGPLLGLEVVRQFDCSGATLIKENSYQNGKMTSEERYGYKYGCVELKGQSSKAIKEKKLASAGLNACYLADKHSTDSDPMALEAFISDEIIYEEMFPDDDDGYIDDFDVSVSAGELVLSTEKAISQGDYTDVTRLCQNLAINILGKNVESKILRNHMKEILKENNAAVD